MSKKKAKRTALRRRQRSSRDALDSQRILGALNAARAPLTREELAARLHVPRHARREFERSLAELERAGDVVQNRAGSLLVSRRLALVAGRVEGHPDGHGFLVPDEGGATIFLTPAEMRQLMHGDRAAVRISGRDMRGRAIGEVVEVLERANRRIVGRLHSEHGVLFLVPEDRRIAHDILVPPAETGRAKAGQVVTVDLVAQPGAHAQPIGRVAEVLGHHADPGMEIEIAVRKFDLPHEFSRKALAQARSLPDEVTEFENRKDLRELHFVTIDGETAKDFDDAVYARREGKGWRLWVAIADVSHYVRPGDALDRDARERGTSVYFPRRVIPMLPEKLSNGLCSLNPNVERLAMVCEMAITSEGEVARYEIYAGVIRSRARLTYTEVWERLSSGRGAEEPAGALRAFPCAIRRAQPARRDRLRHAGDAHGLRRARQDRAHRARTAQRCAPHHRGVHARGKRMRRQLPREPPAACALPGARCAGGGQGRRAARFPGRAGPPAPRRRHPSAQGLRAAPRAHPQAARLRPAADHSPALAQAGGLQPEQRRPLRPRFRGLRALHLAYPALPRPPGPPRDQGHALKKKYVEEDWEALGRHCSETERRADEASRDVENWLKCYYMRDHVGGTFSGSITGVVPFGLFVTLDDYFVDGLVHISELGRDYFQFDPARHMLLGERTGRRYRLADRMTVKLVRVDLDTRKIDLVPHERA